MKEWLRDRRLTLWVVGIVVPLLTVLCFWSTIHPGWPFWLACYIVGLPAGIAVMWVRHRGDEFWSQLEKRQLQRFRAMAFESTQRFASSCIPKSSRHRLTQKSSKIVHQRSNNDIFYLCPVSR